MIQSRSFRDSYSRRHRHKYSNKLLYSPLSSSIKIFMKNSSPHLMDMIKLTPGPLDLRLPQKMTRLKRPDRYEECKRTTYEEFNPEMWPLIRLERLYREWRHVVRVMGPLSNGIYLVVNYYDKGFGIGKGRAILIDTSKLALCNPATHDYKYISIFPCADDSTPSYYLGQKECRVHYGYGMDTTTQDYKVIVVIGWGSRFSSFLSFVYSLKRRTWRKIVDYEVSKRHYHDRKATEGLFLKEQGDIRYPEITRDLELCPQRFFRGCWHWMTIHTNNVYTIMSFDFSDDSFKLMDAPPFYSPCNHLQSKYVEGGGLLVLNDHLAAIFYNRPCFSIEVWMMMEYGVQESWTRIYDVQPKQFTYIRRLVGISSRDDDRGGGGYGIETMFFLDYRNELISCDASGYYKEHGHIDILSGIWWNTLGISTYLETLEPLDC